MLNRRGQFLLLGVLILAICLLTALATMRTPSPRVVVPHSWIYSAELVHAARLGIVRHTRVGGNLTEHIELFLRELYRIAEEEGLDLPPTSFNASATTDDLISSYRVIFNNSVEIIVQWRLKMGKIVLIGKGGGAVAYRVWLLEYYHVYRAPQWGEVRIYPIIWNPDGIAEVLSLSNGNWTILIPLGVDRAILEDEYGVRIEVKSDGV